MRISRKFYMAHKLLPLWLLSAVAGAAVLSPCVGAAGISPLERLHVFLGQQTGQQAAIVWYVRLPRTCGALLAGAALAVSGAVIQSVLANPLAANIIGVNSGAGLAVVLCCAVVPHAVAAVPLAAFTAALRCASTPKAEIFPTRGAACPTTSAARLPRGRN